MSEVKKVVLAYSGGLDTSIILRWLKDEYQCEIVTFTADIGQGEEVEPARAKAEAAGIKEIYIDDLREEFARDLCLSRCFVPTLFTKVSTYLAPPLPDRLIAKRLIEIARETGQMPFPTALQVRAMTRCALSLVPMP